MSALRARLRIEKVVHGGAGLARDHGRVWLVPYTAPGDVIEARAVREHATFVEAACVEVLEPGPDRVEPRCPLFGRCGGCHLQHLSRDAQVEARRGILLESLRRFAGIEGLEPEVVTGADWEYRGRVEFHVGASRIGFFEPGSHDLVPVADCPIAAPEIRRLIPGLQEAVVEARVTGPANLEAVAGADGEVVLVGDGPPGWFPPALPRLLLGLPGVAGVVLHTRGRSWLPMGRTTVPWVVPALDGRDLRVDLDPRGFSQANRGLNQRLVETVVRLAAPGPGEEVLELYAGAGNFTLPLLAASRGGEPVRVTAVEAGRPALETLKQAVVACGPAPEGGPGPLTCLPGRTEVVLRRLLDERRRYDLVVADPPRAGMDRAVRLLPRLGPSRVVLVSCEPATLARDVAWLVEAGYRPDALTFVDMFPQTAHVEAVLRLVADPAPVPA